MGTGCTFFIEDIPKMPLTKLGFIWLNGLREKGNLEFDQSEK
jgi:hypothetical protein